MKVYRIYICCRRTVTCLYIDGKPTYKPQTPSETDVVLTHKVSILHIKLLEAFHKLNIEKTLSYKTSSNQSIAFNKFFICTIYSSYSN